MAPPRRLEDEFFDPRAKSRALGLLWIAGATVGVITLALPHDPDINEAGNLGLAALVFLLAVTVLIPGRLSRDWQVHAAVALSSLILTAGVHFTETTQIYLVMYTWPALFAFYYFPLRLAFAHIAFIAVVFGALLVGDDPMTSPVTRWVLAVGTPIAAGLVVSRLIRRMREQARALARGEERHRLTIQSAHDAFVAIDRHSRIVDWNEAAERMLGWSRATVLGRSYPDLLLPPEERAGHIERREAMLAEPEPVKTGRVLELPFLSRDGRRIPAEVRVTMVEVDGERYLSTFIRDLTERRRREEEQARRLDVERSLERERRIAETLQRSLLPERLPVLPGLAVAGRYLPAAAEAEVGGDWYDVVRTPDGKVGLVMGDIAGKGLAAAAMVGRLRSALRAYVLEGHPPAAAIERLNHLIFTEQDDRPMSTLLVVLFDPTRDTLLWASAG
ncbi:MAG TPA: PAS domain S-box protein, partial [Thermoleophilaceae bacterium]|nr:PAS domain S-box protein [Thermoleophilaceae bacterium]